LATLGGTKAYLHFGQKTGSYSFDAMDWKVDQGYL
jgi:hypothetical protein